MNVNVILTPTFASIRVPYFKIKFAGHRLRWYSAAVRREIFGCELISSLFDRKQKFVACIEKRKRRDQKHRQTTRTKGGERVERMFG